VLPLSLVNRADADVRATVALDPSLAARVVVPQPTVDLPPGQRVLVTPIIYIPRDRFTGRHLDLVVQIRAEDGRLLGQGDATVRTP
jgi:hypothetical protein